jgi:uncharacterized protein (DUF849 family)
MKHHDAIIITVAVTGAFGDRSNEYLPITPKDIATSALDAHQAGAAIAHIHVRDIETGAPSMKFEYYEEVVNIIRAKSDMIINLSTGAGARFAPTNNDPIAFDTNSTLCSPLNRVQHVIKLKPEICSLDIGSLNFNDYIFANCLPHIELMAEKIFESRVKAELEIFDLGHIEIAKYLIDSGKVITPALFQICMGIHWGVPSTAENMVFLKNALPDNSVWSAFGISYNSYNMLAQAVLLGGNVRIGLEDTLYLKKGILAKSNKELVEKAVNIIELLGKKPASVRDAKKMLGIAN